MRNNMLAMFKIVMAVATLLIATLGILYVLELFSDAQVRDMIGKTIKIAAIFVGSGAIFVLLYGKRE